ncbi:SLIB protein, partial [Urocolius indicus]|nr:SLIB protein [Urocolius indicus]
RMQRYADAMFTNHYRTFLGRVSARTFLQTVIGKRHGSSESSSEQGPREPLRRRQSDSVPMDSHSQQQRLLRGFLATILHNHR